MRNFTTTLAAAAAVLSSSLCGVAHAQASDPLAQTLLANDWCGNNTDPQSGKPVAARAHFTTDGSLTVTRTPEGGSPGSQTMGWKVENGQLMLGGEGNWQAFPLDGTPSAGAGVSSQGQTWTAC